MKTLRLLKMALFAMTISVCLMSCSSNDKDLSVSISGTTWKVISVDDEDFNVNENITFHKDGTATLSAHSWIPIKWMFKDNNLVLFFDKDYTKGNFSIKGDIYEPEVNGDVFINNGILIKPIKNANGATVKLNFTG